MWILVYNLPGGGFGVGWYGFLVRLCLGLGVCFVLTLVVWLDSGLWVWVMFWLLRYGFGGGLRWLGCVVYASYLSMCG